MPMSLNEVKNAVEKARNQFRDTRRTSYCWIVAQAIKDNPKIISPENFVHLNDHLRSEAIKAELANDFFTAFKEIAKQHQANYAQLIFNQPEILTDDILSSVPMEIRDLMEEEELPDASEDEKAENEVNKNYNEIAVQYNAQLPANQQQYDEFFTAHYRTILTLAAEAKIPFDGDQVAKFFMNASAQTIVQVWRDPEFGAFFETLTPVFRALVAESILKKMKTNGPARQELLDSPLPNGEVLLHIVSKLPSQRTNYDVRLVTEVPEDKEFTSTTSIVVEAIPEDLDEKSNDGPKYKVKKIVQSDEKGEVKVIALDPLKLRELAGQLELNKKPLLGMNPLEKPSIKEKLTFKAYENLHNVINNKKGHSHYNLVDDVIHHAVYEETNFWRVTPTGESAIVLAAKNKNTPSIAPFIALKKHAVYLTETLMLNDIEHYKETQQNRKSVSDDAEEQKKQAHLVVQAIKNQSEIELKDDEKIALRDRLLQMMHQVKTNHAGLKPYNTPSYVNAAFAKKGQVDAVLAAELKQDQDKEARIRQRLENEDKQIDAINKELGKAALAVASYATTEAEWNTVVDLLDNQAKVNIFDGAAPLALVHHAVINNRMDLFSRITGINNPFEVKDPNDVNINYFNPIAARPVTPLISAAESPTSTMETFNALLNIDGIEINYKAAGETALFAAAKTGQKEKILALLAKKGIDIKSERPDGMTAIKIAEANNYGEVANILKLDALIARLYDNNFNNHEDMSFIENITQEDADQLIANFLNRRDYDDAKFSRTSFILSECIDHYKPKAGPFVLAGLDTGFKQANGEFADTANKLNSMFSLARHSSEKNKYSWLGDLRLKAFFKLQQDLAAIDFDDLYANLVAKKEILVNASKAGIFARHRSTCCLFRFGRTDTQIKLDKMISDINVLLGLPKDDRVAKNLNPRR